MHEDCKILVEKVKYGEEEQKQARERKLLNELQVIRC
jgi:hypothetical protein